MLTHLLSDGSQPTLASLDALTELVIGTGPLVLPDPPVAQPPPASATAAPGVAVGGASSTPVLVGTLSNTAASHSLLPPRVQCLRALVDLMLGLRDGLQRALLSRFVNVVTSSSESVRLFRQQDGLYTTLHLLSVMHADLGPCIMDLLSALLPEFSESDVDLCLSFVLSASDDLLAVRIKVFCRCGLSHGNAVFYSVHTHAYVSRRGLR